MASKNLSTHVIKLSAAQQSALECRDGGGLDPITEAAWDGAGRLVFSETDREDLWGELRDASNAEDYAHQHDDDPVMRMFAGRSARALCALSGRVLKSRISGLSGASR